MPIDSSRVTSDNDVQKINDLMQLIAGGANIANGVIVTYTSNATPDTEDTVTHDLGRVPVGFVVIAKDKAGDVYTGGTADTATAIHLKCAVASVTATVLVF